MTKKKIGKIVRTKKTTQTLTDIKEISDREVVIAIQETPDELRLSAKFKAWTLLFMDKSDRKYWGNATQCALKIYDTDSYHTAGSIGSQNLKKLKLIGAMILENEGMGFGELMKIGASKMLAGSFADWRSMMEILGYVEPPKKSDDNTNNFNFANLNVAIMNDRKKRGLID
jgi:hypothetical protein